MRGRQDEAPVGGPAEVDHEVAGQPAAAPRRRWRWLRRLGVAVVVLLALVPVALQVQAAAVRRQVHRAEANQAFAEGDEAAARTRLASVDTRALDARAEEATAREELARTRSQLAPLGLEEPTIVAVRDETGTLLEALRAQAEALTAAIAEQERLQPAAGSCVLDRVRALARVAIGHDEGSATAACTTVAGHAPSTR